MAHPGAAGQLQLEAAVVQRVEVHLPVLSILTSRVSCKHSNTTQQVSRRSVSCLCRSGTFRVAGAVVVPLVVLQQTLGLVPHLAVALVHHVPLHVLAAAEPLAPLPAPQTQVTLTHLPAQCLRAGKNGQCLTGRIGDLPSGHTNNTNISQNSMVNFRIHKK